MLVSYKKCTMPKDKQWRSLIYLAGVLRSAGHGLAINTSFSRACKTSITPKAISVVVDILAMSAPKCKVGPIAVAPIMHSKGPFLLPKICTGT